MQEYIDSQISELRRELGLDEAISIEDDVIDEGLITEEIANEKPEGEIDDTTYEDSDLPGDERANVEDEFANIIDVTAEPEVVDFYDEDKEHLDYLYEAFDGIDPVRIRRLISDMENAAIDGSSEVTLDSVLESLDNLALDVEDTDSKSGLILEILQEELSTPLDEPTQYIDIVAVRDAIFTFFAEAGESYDESDVENDTDVRDAVLDAFDNVVDGQEVTDQNVDSISTDFKTAIQSLFEDEDELESLVNIVTNTDYYIPKLNPQDIRAQKIENRLLELVDDDTDLLNSKELISEAVSVLLDTSHIETITTAFTEMFGEGADTQHPVDPDEEVPTDDIWKEIEELSEEDQEEIIDDTPVEDATDTPGEDPGVIEGGDDPQERGDSELSTTINEAFMTAVNNQSGMLTSLNLDIILDEFLSSISNLVTSDQLSVIEDVVRDAVADHSHDIDILTVTNEITSNIVEHFIAKRIDAEVINTIKLNFKDAVGDTMTLRTLESQLATFDVVTANLINAEQLNAAKATIREAVIDKLYVNTLNAKLAIIETAIIDYADIHYAEIDDLEAATARIGTLESDNVTINGKLTAAEGNISTLQTGLASANTLIAGKANIDLANVNNAWIQNGVIKNGAISDAQIIGVSANKLTAGTIDASNITVTNLNADNITAGTLNGQRIGQGSLSLDKLSDAVYTESEVDSMLDAMQQEIDGAIETYTGSVVPTLNNYPASGWSTDDRSKHVGDVYYVVNAGNQADGYCYRFTYDNTASTYSWVLIKDSDVTAALQRLLDAEGDIDDLQSFESTTSSWISNTDTELNSLKSRTTAVETGLGDKISTSTFNELSQTVDENSSSITSLTTTVNSKANASDVYTKGQTDDLLDDKADSSTVTTLSNTVNTVSQKADQNESKISNLTTTVESKADGSTVSALSTRVSDVEQDLSGFKTTVSETYAEVSDIPTNISDLTNDTGFITDADVPTKVSELQNDSGYQTSSQVDTAITSKGYATQTALNNEINARKAIYGTSTTAAGTATKGVTCANFALYTGAMVSVKFSNANTATTPALNVNSTGAKTIKSYTGAALSEGEYKWAAGAVLDFVYDGSNWRMMDSGTLTRLKTAETSITQNSESIALKANATDVYTKTAADALLEVKANKATLTSEINASADTVKINADRVNIEGAAIFTGSGRLSTTSLNNTYANVNDIPTDVSDLNNDSGFITSADVPTKVSELQNDSGYQNSTQVNSAITSKGYQTASQVSSAVSSGISNASVSDLSDGSSYSTTAQMNTAISTATTDMATNTSVANTYAAKTAAVKRTQRIYYQNNSTTAPATPGTASSNWVTDNTGDSGKWTKKRMQYSSDNKYIWTCEQSETVSGTVSYTTVLLDDTTTVIDGGNIITGTVTANKLNASDINASKTLTVGAMTDAAAATILNSELEGDISTANANASAALSNISDINDTIAANDAQYNASISDLSDDIANINTDLDLLNGEVTTLSGYSSVMDRIVLDGDTGLYVYGIASSEDRTESVAVHITGDRLNFDKGSNTIAYIGVKNDGSGTYNLNIEEAEIKQSLRFGDFAFVPRSNGNMALKYLGTVEEE